MAKIKVLSEEDAERMLKVITGNPKTETSRFLSARNTLIFLLMYDQGLRINEVCQLDISDLELNGIARQHLSIRAETTKTGYARAIPLTSRTIAAIQKFLNDFWSEQPFCSEDPAFTSFWTKHRLEPRSVQRFYVAVSMALFNHRVHPHMLRHSFATRLMRVCNIRVVQQLLGHRSLNSTQVYTHPNSDDLRKAIDSL